MLTPAQISTLDYHLRETNLLTNEELILELTDHYTTALSECMAQNMTFETSLIDVQAAFGGRNGLQKMERQYNKVTFRHYDETWHQALIEQFQKPSLWRRTLPVYLLILAFSWLIFKPTTTSNFAYGGVCGILLGSSVGWFYILWPYLKTIPFRGLHNIPAEILYLLKRHIFFLLPFYVIGGLGHYLLPLFASPIQFILLSLYLLVYYLFIRTAQIIYATLYDLDTI